MRTMFGRSALAAAKLEAAISPNHPTICHKKAQRGPSAAAGIFRAPIGATHGLVGAPEFLCLFVAKRFGAMGPSPRLRGQKQEQLDRIAWRQGFEEAGGHERLRSDLARFDVGLRL